jgi:hypothetical protein
MADGVDPAVDAMEPACADPPGYGAAVDPGVMKLLDGNDPVLPGCDARRLHIARGAFLPHTESNAPRDQVRP